MTAVMRFITFCKKQNILSQINKCFFSTLKLVATAMSVGMNPEYFFSKFEINRFHHLKAKNTNSIFKRAFEDREGVTAMSLFYASIVWALPISLFLWFIIINTISILIH